MKPEAVVPQHKQRLILCVCVLVCGGERLTCAEEGCLLIVVQLGFSLARLCRHLCVCVCVLRLCLFGIHKDGYITSDLIANNRN